MSSPEKPSCHKRLIIVCIALLTNLFCFSQSSAPLAEDELKIHFLKDSFEIERNNFEFNSCGIHFSSYRSVSIQCSIEAPDFVSVVSSGTQQRLFFSGPQQQLIPIRFIVQGNTSAEWHSVSVKFVVTETGQQLIKNFWIKPKPEFKWRAGLLQQEMMLFGKERNAQINFWVENSGTIGDEYSISFTRENDNSSVGKVINVNLAPNEKKVLTASIDLASLKNHLQKNAAINVYVKSKSGGEKIFIQKLYLVGHEFSQEYLPWKTVPLAIDFSMQSGGYSTPIFSAGVSGNLSLSSATNIAFDSRIIDLRHRQDANVFSKVQFQTRDWSVSAGTMMEFHHFMINGNGLAISKDSENSSFRLAASKSRIGNTNQVSFEGSKKVGSLNFTSDNFLNDDRDQQVKSLLSVNTLKWIVSRKTSISFSGGLSTENVTRWKQNKTLPGSMYGYTLESSWRSFDFKSELQNYSSTFPGFNKGYAFHDHEIKKKFATSFLSAYYVSNKKQYTNNLDSLFSTVFNINNLEYGFKGGNFTKNFSAFLSSGLSFQKQDSINSLETKSWNSAANLMWKFGRGYSLLLGSNVGLIKIQGRRDIDPFVAANSFGSLQHNRAGIYFQLSTGPFYYFEVKEFLSTNKSFSKLHLAPYYEHLLPRYDGTWRLQVAFNKEQPEGFQSFSVNNQIRLNPPSLHAEINFNSSFNLTQKGASYFYLSVRKELRLPVFKNAVSNNFTVLLFKDRNNNSVYDKSDEVIPNSSVIVNDQLVRSNENGQLFFCNIGADAIRVNFSTTNEKGWVPAQGLIQTIAPTKKLSTIYVPFKESKFVSGKLVMVAATKSTETFELSNIRITALDGNGGTYTTLTDAQGAFNFNLPAGNYIISINGAAFDSKLKPVDVSKGVDLVNNDLVNIHFEVRERKRQINLHRSEE